MRLKGSCEAHSKAIHLIDCSWWYVENDVYSTRIRGVGSDGADMQTIHRAFIQLGERAVALATITMEQRGPAALS
jgi:hypothetical protein